MPFLKTAPRTVQCVNCGQRVRDRPADKTAHANACGGMYRNKKRKP